MEAEIQNKATYTSLAKTARAWVYQSSRVLSDKEVEEIAELTESFIAGWDAHGAQLYAAYKIEYNVFLALFVDEVHAGASGCSIDKSVKFIQELEKRFGVEFMNRLMISYFQDGEIKIEPLARFSKLIEEGVITENTIVFNNLVSNKGEFEEKWEVPLKDSWHKQLMG